MTTYAIPTTVGFSSVQFGLENNNQVFESPLSNSIQVSELTGARWYATFNLPPMKKTNALEYIGFLQRLQGRVHSFYGYDANHRSPSGTIAGSTLLVNGASQTGTSLVLDGGANSTLVLKAGDFFSVNNELKMVTADATTDGSGDVTVNFVPSLRSSPSDDASITTTNPVCTMKLTGDSTTYSINSSTIYGISFSGVEVF
tara:strand:- start:1127 stop:1726 length:600 start_codon:yes stop_codon:yes gene_type:complete